MNVVDTSVIIAGLLGVAWLAKEVVRRSIDPGTCIKCGYTLRVQGEQRCSECGTSVPTEHHDGTSWRRPRSPRRIVAATSLLIALLVLSGVRHRFWLLSQVPTPLVIALAPIQMPMVELSDSVMDQELVRRVRAGLLSRDDNLTFLRRQLQELDRQGRLVRSRDKWPAGLPMRMSVPHLDVDLISSEPIVIIASIEGTNSPHEWAVTSVSRANPASLRVQQPFDLGVTGDGVWHHREYLTFVDSGEVEFSVTYSAEFNDSSHGATGHVTMHLLTQQLCVEIVDRAEDAITPFDDPAFTRRLQQAFRVSVCDQDHLWIEADATIRGLPVALGFTYDLIVNDERYWSGSLRVMSDALWRTHPVREHTYWSMISQRVDAPLLARHQIQSSPFVAEVNDMRISEIVQSPQYQVELHITGDSATALASVYCDQYWSGEIRIPVRYRASAK